MVFRSKLLEQKFFLQKTEETAKELLGKVMTRETGGRKISGVITETEAYLGINDKACHSSKGLTPRTKIMFGPPGYWYIYLVYGMYYCLNLVTEPKGNPCAVLIRSLKPLNGLETGTKTNGPGKLCRALKINQSLNAKKANSQRSKLYLEDWGIFIPTRQIKKTKRIGVNYAGEKWRNRKLRFYVENF